MMMMIGNQGRSTRSVTKNVPATMAFVAVALHGALKCNRRQRRRRRRGGIRFRRGQKSRPLPRQPIRCHDSDRMTIPSAAEAAAAISNLQQSASILMAHESRPPRPREISPSHCEIGNESTQPRGSASKPARLIAPDIIWAPFSLCDKAGNRFDAPRPLRCVPPLV